jgi:hypothetical protein
MGVKQAVPRCCGTVGEVQPTRRFYLAVLVHYVWYGVVMILDQAIKRFDITLAPRGTKSFTRNEDGSKRPLNFANFTSSYDMER